MHIAYIVNTYPRPSHSFIRREIRALERSGLQITRLAMRGDPSALVDPDDIQEHALTQHILSRPKAAILRDCLWALTRPGFFRALGQALDCGKAGQGTTPGTGGRLRHMIYLAEAASVARLCLRDGVAHMHAHFGTNAATVAMLAHHLSGIPYSFTVHGPEEFDAPRALALGEKIRHAAFAVAISSFGRSQLMRWAAFPDWARLHVVHCGIEPDRFDKPAPVPAGPRRLVCIGRFSEQKGQALLIRAFAKAVKSAPDLHLSLVGDGELRPALEALIDRHGIAAHVTLTGWLDEAGVRGQLADAHALVLPSFAEGLPMVVMEAMAAARPVLCTTIAGVPELVQDRTCGWLVPSGDCDALADAIYAFSQTPLATLTEMGNAGRARVMARHDIDRSAQILTRHFRSASSGTRS